MCHLEQGTLPTKTDLPKLMARTQVEFPWQQKLHLWSSGVAVTTEKAPAIGGGQTEQERMTTNTRRITQQIRNPHSHSPMQSGLLVPLHLQVHKPLVCAQR